MTASFVLGPLVYFENILGPKYAFCLLQVFAAGWVILTEGLMDLGLYSTFKSRFWREILHEAAADEIGED